MARSLGHTIGPTTPALVPLGLPAGHPLTELSGLSVPAQLTLCKASGKVLQKMHGPLLFTHFGLSGPVVLDMSRHWIKAKAQDPGATLSANVVDGATLEELDARLLSATQNQPRATIAAVLRDWLPAPSGDEDLCAG